MTVGNEALQIYEELITLLPDEDEFIDPKDPVLLEGVHSLCLKHGTDKMQLAFDTLAGSEEFSHRLAAASFRRKLDCVTTVMGFEGAVKSRHDDDAA
jgi:hypothetical protein